jgi:hypothetical protein
MTRKKQNKTLLIMGGSAAYHQDIYNTQEGLAEHSASPSCVFKIHAVCIIEEEIFL